MGLMPIYYTTTKMSGKRKSSVRNQRLNREHEKWLRGMGIDKPWKPKRERLAIPAAKKSERYQSVGDGIGNGFVKTTSTLSGDYIIGQAYNKGNLVVLSKDDAKDETTGKRR
tara:strand:+ start:516 stop:851 length:336 start_codon:yes stop_codon:yes gene_type:complete